MSKKDILKMETTAYYSGFNGLEIKRFKNEDFLDYLDGVRGEKHE